MNKRLPLILILIMSFLQLSLQSQPGRLKCTEVLQNGDVMLHWQPDSNLVDFKNYTIYHSHLANGPYNSFPEISDVLQDSFLHAGAGADSSIYYYYMITNMVNGSTASSDTLATMLLETSTYDYEVIEISWTPLHTPLPFLPEMYPWYFLYREYPPGNWAKVDSTQDLSLNHQFWPCNCNNDTVRFRIGVRYNDIDCMSFSNQKGAVLNNHSNHFPPVMDSVSINADGKAILGWQAASEPDILGYKIFLVTSTNDSIDYVEGRLTSSYLHPYSDPCTGPLRYIIITIDSCGNESPFPFDSITFQDKPHSTIYLSDIQYDPILMTNHLLWNEYINFDPPLEFYRIYVSENGSSYELLTTILPGQTSYLHNIIQPNSTYSYYIRAYSQDHLKSSTSCRKSISTYSWIKESIFENDFHVYPNPFSDFTIIEYELKYSIFVNLSLLNTFGQEVEVLLNEYQDKGEHQVILNAVNLPSGIYFCRLKADDQFSKGKVMVVR